ncbi:MAG: hypothetical protein ACRDO7_00375 [Nocardioidaceae bacterium]
MPEVLLDFPRSFTEFTDPADDGQVYRCDLTWLTSQYMCIFGQGCKGIYASAPDAGCCTLGAHFADKDDEKRVRRFVKKLGPETWQNYEEGRRNGWLDVDEDGDRKTRTFDGACIFHNDPDFEGGYGCALHKWALDNDLKPHEVKPDVCWQLPIRRQYREVDRGDGTSYLEVQIGEYVRSGWGAGGHEFDWYCTANTEAHVAPDPLYVTNEDELVALMGRPAYDVLVGLCEEHLARRPLATRHPADPQ